MEIRAPNPFDKPCEIHLMFLLVHHQILFVKNSFITFKQKKMLFLIWLIVIDIVIK